MKRVPIFAVAAIAALSVASYASAATCSRPSKPAIPDGATASEDAMKGAQPKVVSYVNSMNTYLHCVADELSGAKSEAQQVSDDWKRQSDIFVKTPAKAQ
jgi:hypothetical protein